MGFFLITVNFRIKKDKFCETAQLLFLSVSLVRGKFEGMRENLKHKNRT